MGDHRMHHHAPGNPVVQVILDPQKQTTHSQTKTGYVACPNDCTLDLFIFAPDIYGPLLFLEGPQL